MPSKKLFKKGDLTNSTCEPLDEPIDVVFTWVNGSDPIFLAQLTKERKKHESESINIADIHNKRFEGEITNWFN